MQSTNGGKYLQVYEDYIPSSLQKKENAILKALWDEYEQHKMDGAEVYQLEDGLVFLSYASEQEKIVREFYEAEKNKHKLWMDIELIKKAELKLQVDRILNSCVMAVIFLSKEYLIKAWTRYEFLRLLEEKEKRNIKIIIVPLTAGVEDVITQYCSMNSSICVKDIGELSDWLSIEQSNK